VTTPGPETTVPIGVYHSPAADIGPVQEYEAFLGMPAGTTVAWVLAFMADNPSWAQFENAILAASTNGPPGTTSAISWAGLLGPRKLMLAVPACCQGTSWANEASGVNDGHWTGLARTLVNGGLADCALRIAREFSAGWYRWKASPANVSDFAAGWTRIVHVMRSAGFTGKFIWNPYLGQGNFGSGSDVAAAYPADSSVVDAIGLDFYDGPSSNYPPGEVIRTLAQQQAVWNSFLTQTDGLNGWRNFAAGKGKPLCYPEWGLRLWNDGSTYTGGGDNPLLIREMAAWLKDSGAWMHALWEDPGRGVCDPDNAPFRQVAVPQARAAFLAAFGWQ
jgi:hypothetical protein